MKASIHDALTQPPMTRCDVPAMAPPCRLPTALSTELRSRLPGMLSIIGAVLLLLAFSQPLLQKRFVTDQLLPNLAPGLFTGDAPTTPLALSTPLSTGLTRSAASAPHPDRQKVLAQIDLPANAHGFSIARFAALLMSVEQSPAARGTPSRTAARLFLAVFITVGIFAFFTALFTILRRFSAPERIQAGVQITFGLATLAVFVLPLLLVHVDPQAAQQIIATGLIPGAIGAALIFAGGALSLRGRDYILCPIAGLLVLGAVGTMAALAVTL